MMLERIGLLFFLILLSGTLPASERVSKHLDAVKTLKSTHFFYEGRGMILPPNLIKLVDRTDFLRSRLTDDFLRNRFGLRMDKNKQFIGLFTETYRQADIGVLGCVFCHSGRAAGREIPGLGNKNVDVAKIGSDLVASYKLLDPIYRGYVTDPKLRDIYLNSKRFVKVLSDPKLANKTAGLVPVSMIRYWFYGGKLPDSTTPGAVKVPHMWGYGEKRKVGQFCDGGGDGNLPGWGAAVELAAGQTHHALQNRDYLHKLENLEHKLGEILPPKYPFAINPDLARKGKNLFAKKCMGCHGSYERDSEGLAKFVAPKHIPLHVVQTDDDRLKGNTEQFYKLVAQNPASDLIKANVYPPGYFAPRLEGVWARFPYLHNASVPTLYDLLSAPKSRPKYFSLLDAGEYKRFDQKKVGLKVPRKGSIMYYDLVLSRERTTYKVTQLGQSNRGHYNFGPLSETQKYSLIEYLKTL